MQSNIIIVNNLIKLQISAQSFTKNKNTSICMINSKFDVDMLHA